MRTSAAGSEAGFTLIEVVVALAVIASALAAAARAQGLMAEAAARRQFAFAASSCAKALASTERLRNSFPPIGERFESCSMASGPEPLRMLIRVEPTPNPSFRRVEVLALEPGEGPGPGSIALSYLASEH